MAGGGDTTRTSDASGEDVHIRTFLIADVRGYTLFTQERGGEAAGKLAARFAELASRGDGGPRRHPPGAPGRRSLCVFGSPRQAIRTAVDMQERFVEETLATRELPLTVGIGQRPVAGVLVRPAPGAGTRH